MALVSRDLGSPVPAPDGYRYTKYLDGNLGGSPPDVTASQVVPDDLNNLTSAAFDLDGAQYFTGTDVGTGTITFVETDGTLSALDLALVGNDVEGATPNEGSVTGYWRWTDGVDEFITNTFTISFIVVAADIDYEALGYELVDNWANVFPNSTTVSSGLQAAIDFAYANDRTLLFTAGAFYTINTTLRAEKWRPWSVSQGGALNTVGRAHNWWGSAAGARPIIRLAASAPLFDNASAPRPMVCFRTFAATNSSGTSTTSPSDPLTTPANYRDDTADMFDDSFRNIDLDTNGHAGAIGLYAPMAQRSMIAQVRVVATGSHTGIWGFPGRNSISLDVEVEGGQYGVRTDAFSGLTPAAGSCITGLRLYNQTVAPIVVGDFVPLAVVGFDIQPASNIPAYVVTETSPTGSAVASFIDGKVTLSGGSPIAFDNAVLKGMYLRNVYVTGSNNLVRSGATTHTGTGTWKLISEYCSNDLDGAASPASQATALRSRSLINGTVDRVQEPVNSIQSAVSAPPSDIVTRHIPRIHDIDDGDPYILITDPPYNAVSSASRTGTDDRAAIQAAAAAAVSAGHGRVFVPKGANGLFYVGSPGINLPAGLNAMWGIGHLGRGGIGVHSSWQPTTGSPAIITTDNSASAETQLHSLTLEIRCIGGTGGNTTTPYQYDRFSHIQWRAGRASTTFWIEYDKEFVTPTIPCNTRIVLDISANGGGRHYGTETDGRGRAAVGHRVVRATSTTEPLAFYGLSGETSKGNSASFNPATNFEFSGASNVRIYSMKREGTAPTATVDDCTNFAAYSSGAMRQPDSVGTGYWQITGTSSGILVANVLVQSYDGTVLNRPTLIEDLDTSAAFSITWPEGVSLYKRGTINDSLMVFS